MPIQYHISGNDTSSTVTLIFSDGNTTTVPNTLPAYAELIALLTAGEVQDEARILALATPALSAGMNLTRLSERVIFDRGQIFFDGDVIDTSVAKVIVRIINEGGTSNAYGSLVAFLEKLYQNPSLESRTALYDFIESHDISILPDGDFLAYKGVDKNARSIFSGYGIVDGVVFEKDHLLNKVGSTIEIPRSMVDSNRNNGCSVGLHVGSYDYAKDFSRGILLTVKVNPRDIVSVPADGTFHKIRTSRYVVMGHTEVKIPTVTSKFTADNDWADDRRNGTPTAVTVEAKKANDFYETLNQIVEGGVLPFLDFSYRSPVTGRASTVESFEVENVVKQWGSEVRLTGVNVDGDYRSYLFSGMTNIIVNDEPYAPVVAPVTPSAPAVAVVGNDVNAQLGVLRSAVESGLKVNFNYVTTSNVAVTVDGFTPEVIDETRLLVTGVNDARQYRSYAIQRVSNVTVTDDNAPIVDTWASKTFEALQDDTES